MKMKKLLSAILAGAMTLGLMSVPAFADDNYVAQIGSTKYETLQAAVDAAAETAFGDSKEIKLLKDATGAGVVIDKSVAINFQGHTYTFSDPAVGSDGTKTNGFQLLEGSNPNRKNAVWLKNGSLKVAEENKEKFYILVQNYANLTLVDMNLDATYCDRYTGETLPEGATTSSAKGYSFALSNNSGIVHMVGKTSITANDDGEHSYAFDVCKFGSYKLPMVIVNTTGKIEGNIDYDSKLGEDKSHLCIEQGEFTADVGAYVSANSSWDPTKKKVTRNKIATVDGVEYDNLADAVAAGSASKIVKLTADATGEGVVVKNGVTIDFQNHTYSVNRGVGSTGSETNGFQLTEGDKNNKNAVVFKNGSIKVADNCEGEFTILLQNYSNLTLENMSLDGNGLDREYKTSANSYVVSNCSGVNHFVGNTSITANESGKGFAFDVDKKDPGYSLPMVIVDTTGTITGGIEYSENYGTDKSRLFISQGKFETDVSDFVASTSTWNSDTKTVTRDNVAFIGETGYPSLQAAVAAATAGETITLLENKFITDGGVVIPEGKKLTIDFNNSVYRVNRGVGSTGTETNGFQLLKNSTLTFKNGEIEVAEACASRIAVLVMNYADLTLEDMDIDGGNVMRNAYKNGDGTWVLSVNNGDVKLTGHTIIRTPELPEAYALDVWDAPAYDCKPSVTIDTVGIIYGNVQTYKDKTVLKVEQGAFTFDASGYINSETQFIVKSEDVDDDSTVVIYAVAKKASNEEAAVEEKTGVELGGTTEGTAQRADVVTIGAGKTGYVQYTATKGDNKKAFGTYLKAPEGFSGAGNCAFGILLYNIPSGWEIGTPDIAVYNMD